MSEVAPESRESDGAAEAVELALWANLAEGFSDARERLFERHLAFARRIASRYFRERNRGDMEFADLHQLACAGLLEAIDGFDPSRGVPFRGYAARRISGSILDGIARMTEVREQLSFRGRVQRDRLESLASARAEDGSRADAFAALADLAIGLAVGFMLEGTALFVPDDAADHRPGPYEGVALARMAKRMREEIVQLPERDRAILHYHYEEGMIFDQIGELLGITKGRVSQLHRGALELLRKRLRQAGHFRLQG
jgi:RNA polymerase sigma factor for flagellar operon FliA